MNDQTLKLLEKALQVSPDDWETRAHLLEICLAQNQPARAAEILRAAPRTPDDETAQLLKARVESETDPAAAIITLEGVIARNRASAQAYLLLARVYRKRGLRDEARKKYGAATIIDESIHDPELAAWLDGGIAASDVSKPGNDSNRAGNASSHIPKDELVGADEMEGLEEFFSGDEEAAPGGASAGAAQARRQNNDDADDPHAERDDEHTEHPEADDSDLGSTDAPDDNGGGAGAHRVTFHDVGGMEDVIERIRMNIVYPFKNPEVFRKFNKKPGGGILMYGPPGCGKTHLARATAGECGAKFITIAITDILSKWMGESEKRLHDIFERARRQAPAVIFMDEIDAIGMSRSDAGSYQAPIVNVLLTELDGIQSGNASVMVLAATNVPWRVDSALRRPGRFDRVLFVPPPDLAARQSILNIHLRGLPSKGLDAAKLARGCDKFSGADLRAAVERASEKAIYQEMRTGRASELTQAMLQEAIKETKPSTMEWLETARSYASYANRAGLYDDLVAYFEK